MKTKQRNNLTPILLALVVMMFWGSLYPIVKFGYKVFQIDTSYYPNLLLFAGVRFTISGLCISLFQIAKKKTVPVMQTKKEWLGILLVGLFSVILNYACTFYGLSVVESSKTALLKQAGALVVIVFSALFIKEDKLTLEKGIGAALGLASIVILNCNALGFSLSFGAIVIVLSSFCTVIASVICKKTLKGIDAVVMTGYSQTFGGFILLIIGISCGGSMALDNVGAWGLLAWIVFATCVSYSLWYTIVQKYELSKLFIVKLSEPVFAAIISAILLKENLLQWHYVGAFLCIATAVVISNMKLKKLLQSKTNLQTENIENNKTIEK